MRDADDVALDGHVMVGRRDIDPAVLNSFAVVGMGGGKSSSARQDFRQNAAAAGDVQHDQDGGAQVPRKTRHDRRDCLDPAGRRADQDDVMCGHAIWLSLHHVCPAV